MNANVTHDLVREIQNMAVALKDNGILDEGDPLLSQSFVEGETFIPEIVGAVVKSIDEDGILVTGIKALIEELQARKSRIEGRAENKRGLIELALMRAEIKSVETPAATVSLRAVPPKIASVDESLIPSEYFTVPTPALDKRKLLADLKEGKQVPGAVLSNGGQSITIRRH
jgi:hypothetical protein